MYAAPPRSSHHQIEVVVYFLAVAPIPTSFDSVAHYAAAFEPAMRTESRAQQLKALEDKDTGVRVQILRDGTFQFAVPVSGSNIKPHKGAHLVISGCTVNAKEVKLKGIVTDKVHRMVRGKLLKCPRPEEGSFVCTIQKEWNPIG